MSTTKNNKSQNNKIENDAPKPAQMNQKSHEDSKNAKISTKQNTTKNEIKNIQVKKDNQNQEINGQKSSNYVEQKKSALQTQSTTSDSPSVIVKETKSQGLFGSILSTSWYSSQTEIPKNVTIIGSAGEITNMELENGIVDSLKFEADSLDFNLFKQIIIDIIKKNFFGKVNIVSSEGNKIGMQLRISSNPFKIYDLASLIMKNETYIEKFKNKSLNTDIIQLCLQSIENVYQFVDEDRYYMINDKRMVHQNYILNYMKSSRDSIANIIKNYDQIVSNSFLQNKTLVLLYILKDHEFEFHKRLLKKEKKEMIRNQFSHYEKHMDKIDNIKITNDNNRKQQKIEIVFMDERYFDESSNKQSYHLDHLNNTTEETKQDLKKFPCFGETTIEEVTFYDSSIDMVNFIINANAIPVVIYNGNQYVIGAKIPFNFELNK